MIGALKTSALVGTMLNLVNQGPLLFAESFADLSVGKVIFTYCVPLFVSAYGITMTRLRFEPGARAPVAAVISLVKTVEPGGALRRTRLCQIVRTALCADARRTGGHRFPNAGGVGSAE